MASGIFKHSYKTKTRESLPIAIYNSGVQQCAPLHTWGPGLRDHFLVHQVISGKGRYVADGVQYQLQAGDSFIVYPSTIVSYTADEQEPWEYCWVGFNGAEAKLLLSQTPFQKDRPVVRFSNPESIRASITAVYTASGATAASELRAIGYLYIFLALLIEQGGALPSTDQSLEYVESAIRFIAHNYSSPIDTNAIADSVGISRSHLYRVFIKHLGTPPNQYLTRFRISQACELIEHSNLPISAVAASSGYDDQLYFSRVFKKVVGKPPSAYQKDSQLLQQKGS